MNFSATTSCEITTAEFLSPHDALAIDTKMDDGIPTSGIVAARGGITGLESESSGSGNDFGSNAAGCVVRTYESSNTYNTQASVTSGICELRIRMN